MKQTRPRSASAVRRYSRCARVKVRGLREVAIASAAPTLDLSGPYDAIVDSGLSH